MDKDPFSWGEAGQELAGDTPQELGSLSHQAGKQEPYRYLGAWETECSLIHQDCRVREPQVMGFGPA